MSSSQQRWALISIVLAGLTLGAPAALAAAEPDEAAAGGPEGAASGVDLAALDTSVTPCEDFYQFACGDWLADAPTLVPSGGAARLGDTGVRVRSQVQELLAAAARNDAARSPAARRVGDFYASCMDTGAIEARGLAPLEPDLGRIDALRDRAGLAALAARLHQAGAGVLFTFGAETAARSGGLVTGVLGPGGMGLPDPALYLGNDRRSLAVRGRYLAHVTRMLELLGERPEEAEAGATAVVQIETGLARAALGGARGGAGETYHKLSRQQLAALTPGFDWDAYFGALGTPGTPATPPKTRVVVSDPDFWKELESLLASTRIERWRSYLRWHLAQASAELLPRRFGAESEAFFSRMQGIGRQTPPRGQVCATLTAVQLGDELAAAWVERWLSPEARSRAAALTAGVVKALAADLAELPWLSEPSRRQALAKLGALRVRVGYPDPPHGEPGPQIVRGDALGNWQRGHAASLRRQLARVGKPPDRDSWRQTPLAAAASYLPLDNALEVPAALLQPPVFDPAGDPAANCGAAGAFIGAELSHGFDEEGSRYDAQGRLAAGWTEAERREYERRAGCFADQASELGVSGTPGDPAAVAAGLRLAHAACQASLAAGGQGRQKREGFTPEQRFFLAFAQGQCTREPEAGELGPARLRVDGTLSNLPEFQQAFGCKAGAPMVHTPACRVF
jgi:putative endopeptidase